MAQIRISGSLVSLAGACVGILVGSFLAAVISGVGGALLRQRFGPAYAKFMISLWLEREPYYLSEFELMEDVPEPFRFRVTPSGSEYDIVIQPVEKGGLLRVYGNQDLEPEHIAVILDNDQARRNLRTQIESVLVNSPAQHRFVNANGDPVDFSSMTGIKIEYRIYWDDLSRQELMNGITTVDSILDYTKARSESIFEDFNQQR